MRGLVTEVSVPLTNSAPPPPRFLVLIADWGNLLAGVSLTIAFFIGALIFSIKTESLLTPAGTPTPRAIDLLQFFLSLEGALYFVGCFCMVGVCASQGNVVGALQFVILTAGSIMFAFSGLVFPNCIVNITYIFSKQTCLPLAVTGGGPFAWHAMAHFGITCFMVGTSIGLKGVMGLPKGQIVSPFWGCAFFCMGAWTIGIFKFWGPVLAGGFENSLNPDIFTSPAATWSWNWWAAMLGAIFLTIGAAIFMAMNKSYALK